MGSSGAGIGLAIRRATLADLDMLLELCRAAFPASLRWAVELGGGREWWRQALTSPGAETWAIESASGLLGCTLLLTDETAWADRSAARTVSVPRRAAAVALAPEALLRHLAARLRPRLAASRTGGTRIAADQRIFVELFAVLPAARGRGLGRQLVRHARRRAADLGRAGTCYRVDRRNAPMLKLMTSEGYAVSARLGGCCFLTRLG